MSHFTQDVLPSQAPAIPRRRPTTHHEVLAARLERAVRRDTGDKVRGLHVEVDEEAVVLTGRCATYYCKQLAQHAVMDHLEGRTLANQIEVW